VLVLIVADLSVAATPQTRRHVYPKRTSSSAKAAAAAEKSAAEMRAARQEVAQEIKVLTHFMYLLGGIEKGIEMTAAAGKDHEASPVALELNDRSKAKVRASISNVRQGLEKLETDFRVNPARKNYYFYLTGLTNYGEVAETQAGASRFDEAGRSLLKALDKMTDALAAMH
jgi:hypothetical protein